MDGKRPVMVWLTEEEIRARADVCLCCLPGCATCTADAQASGALTDACRAALDGEGATLAWKCQGCGRLYPGEFERHGTGRPASNDPDGRGGEEECGPPVRVVVVEVKK